MSSRTRSTSGHVPIIAQIATRIPKSKIFRFDNYWTKYPGFRQTVAAAWCCRNLNSDPSGAIYAKLKNTRRILKRWQRFHANIPQQELDCKIVINLLDHIEENRILSAGENNLHTIITSVLSRVANAKLSISKQRSKVRAAIGDENTRYFHACANQRRRKNHIQVIESDGIDLHTHDHKAFVLHDFYHNLLGTNVPTRWDFSLHDLYPEGPLPLQDLAEGFSTDEISSAMRRIHSTASPGPDGFGAHFFKTCWVTVSSSLINLPTTFHTHSTDLSCINRSFLVLLPKKTTLVALRTSGQSPCKTLL
jgi:hypothetical protein